MLFLATIGCGDDTPADAGSSTGTDSSTGTGTPTGTTLPPDGTSTSTTEDTTGDTTADTTAGTGPEATGTTGSTGGSSTTDGSTSAGSSSEGSSSSGPGLEPEIEVEVDSIAIDTGDSHEFADTVDVGVSGAPVTVTIDNVGTGALNITGVSISAGDAGHFTLDAAGLDVVVDPGESTSFTVAFSPTNGGIKGATISIENDDADEAPFEIVFGAHTTEDTYRNLSPVVGPSARFNTALTDLEDGRVLLFGGRDAAGVRLDDTWVFDLETGVWTQLTPATSPSMRDAHRMVYAGNDTVILFGGNTQLGSGGTTQPQQETWSFDVVAEDWTLLAPATVPPARYQHAMVRVGAGSILVYGGQFASFNPLDDTWLYDAGTNTWTDLAPPASPPGRASSAIGFDGVDTVSLFGGSVPFTAVDETWNYSVAGNTWTLASPPASPGDRTNVRGAYHADGSFIFFSGKPSITLDPIAGTFGYAPDTDTWTDLAAGPTPRYSYASAYVAGANKSIMFGGNALNDGPSSALDETWEYVGPRP